MSDMHTTEGVSQIATITELRSETAGSSGGREDKHRGE
jgi:hypothetical protein